MPDRVLSLRALNRALMERQLLSRRHPLPPQDAIERVVGLQAQEPPDPYFGLHARLEDFRVEQLGDLLTAREVVRIVLMRSTIHLVTARDAVALRPLVQPVLDRELAGPWGKRVATMDIDAVVAAGRELLAEQPLTARKLGQLLGERWPDQEPQALAYAVRCRAPLVQVPPRGLWGASHAPTHTTVEAWTGLVLDPAPSLEAMVRRYLAAFGPATVGDVQAWSRLTGLRDVVEAMRPTLVTFRDERGRELFDVPGAPLPDPDTPLPPRFLPIYDNVLLSHADRARVVTDEDRRRLEFGGRAFLVDGFVCGGYTLTEQDGTAVLAVTALRPLSDDEVAAVDEEGARLLALTAPQAQARRVEVR